MNEFLARIVKLSPKKLAFLAAELQSRLNALERARTEPIAIVGLSCRFPGEANDPESFWQLLHNGVDAITEVPSNRWDIATYYDPDPEAPGKMYTRWGGFLEEVDQFDSQFFSIAPREAVSLDPQHRLLLEVSWEALERAGYAPNKISGSRTGVFVGITANDYSQLLERGGPRYINSYRLTGNPLNFASGRLSYTFGLQGPSIAVDTACSSSLVTVHLACQSLRTNECRMALAGGVNLILTPENTITTSKAKMLSPDGRCKTFDASADGIGRAEGCGIVVLKRLSDARADGDNILALIRGSAVNQDGPSSGLTVPNGLAQEALLREALANAGVEPHQVSYIEAHGTGTSLGDPIEARALGTVFAQGRAEDNPVVIGSAKTNIGHTESAAGIAGLIKVVLALQHQEIPPHLHLKTLNPHISWNDFPVVIPTQPLPWPSENGPRIAGVSAFGGSGTNAHVVVEEAPARQPVQLEIDRPLHLLSLSAKTETALKQLAERYAQHLAAQPTETVADICFSANTGRMHFAHRLAVVAKSTSQVSQKLAAFAADQHSTELLSGQMAGTRQPKVAFLFTGQGSQYPGMGRQLYETQPSFRQTLERCDELLRPYLDQPLSSILYPEEGMISLLDQTTYMQPALFALEYALAELWQSWGIVPTVVMGHSLGEYVAACVAGVFSLEDGLKLVAERGRLIQALPANGQMATVFAETERVRAAIAPYADTVAIAAINGAKNTVISGEDQAVQAVLKELETAGIRVQMLNVSHAFHSPLMEPILDTFEQRASEVKYQEPRISLVSTVSGFVVGQEITEVGYWRRQLRQTVRFAQAMESLDEQGCELFVEVGPSPTLLGLGRRYLQEKKQPREWLPSLRKGREDWQQMLDSLAELYVHGLEINWSAFEQDYAEGRQRVVLPTYPYQRERYWIEGAQPTHPPAMIEHQKQAKLHPLLGKRLRSPAMQEIVFESQVSQEIQGYITDHRVFGTVVLPAAAYLEMAIAAAEETYGQGNYALEDVVIQEALIIPENEIRTVQLILTPQESDTASFKIFSVSEDEKHSNHSTWTIHVTGKLRTGQTASISVTPELASPEALQERCNEQMSGTSYYQKLRDNGFQFGPNFQGVERLWRRDGEALAQIRLPETLISEAGIYQIHPVLLDSCIQIFGAALPGNGTQANEADTYLPMGLERFQVYDRVSTRLWSQALLRPNGGEDKQILTGDIHLFSETGQLVAKVEGLYLKRAPREMLQQTIKSNIKDWLYEIDWEETQGDLELTKSEPAQPGTWLIFADQGGVGAGLVTHLQNQGEQCVLVTSDQQYSAAVEDRLWQINPENPAHFQRLLEETGNMTQPLRGVIYLWGLDGKPGKETAQAQICGGALHLVQALVPLVGTDFAGLWLVTRGARSVGAEPRRLAVAQAPLWGLGGTIAPEHPGLKCVRVDLDPQPKADESQALFNLIRTPNGENQVALRDDLHYVARLMRSRSTDDTPKSQLRVTEEALPASYIPQADATYLISGGLGGLGIEMAKWLVARGARHLVLVGRSGATETSLDAVHKLEEVGAQIVIAQADVSRREQMARVLAKIDEAGLPLRGIIHAAGVVDDGVLLRQNWERFAHVMAPKVDGAWNLHLLTRDRQLDFFVFFSSMVSMMDTPGQGNYAAANAFLDTLAHWRQTQGLPGLSINWGPWAEVGMAATMDDYTRANWKKLGVQHITARQGVQVFERILQMGKVQVGVFSVNWSKLMQQFPANSVPSFLANLAHEVQEQLEESQPSIEYGGLLQRLAEVPPNKRRNLLLTYVREQAIRVLALDPFQPLDLRQPLNELGLDSLMAVELRNTLERAVKRNLAATVIFDYPTVEALTDYLAQEIIPLAGESQAGLQKELDRQTKEISISLDNLAEEEMAALLAEKLSNIAEGESKYE
ncbi:type I polyketide synthase [Chloroflexota bacterium]